MNSKEQCAPVNDEKNLGEILRTRERVIKARYGHVVQAMKLGGAYSFDREAFSRLAPLAQQDGIDLVDFTPDTHTRQEGPVIPLMRLTWTSTQ